MEEERKETRADILDRIIKRMDRLEEMGIIGKGGDIMIDVEEAAAIACVAVNTILTWGQNAIIPRYKLNTSVRFGLREFCNWVASCRQPAIGEKKHIGQGRTA